MTKTEVVKMLLKLLELPEAQKWVSLEDLLSIAEKVDGTTH